MAASLNDDLHAAQKVVNGRASATAQTQRSDKPCTFLAETARRSGSPHETVLFASLARAGQQLSLGGHTVHRSSVGRPAWLPTKLTTWWGPGQTLARGLRA